MHKLWRSSVNEKMSIWICKFALITKQLKLTQHTFRSVVETTSHHIDPVVSQFRLQVPVVDVQHVVCLLKTIEGEEKLMWENIHGM